MITVIEQNVATNFNAMQDIYMQQSRVAKFDCSWEEYINSYVTGKPIVGIGLGKEQRYSGYSFSKKEEITNLKYDIEEGVLFCILNSKNGCYRFARLVEED